MKPYREQAERPDHAEPKKREPWYMSRWATWVANYGQLPIAAVALIVSCAVIDRSQARAAPADPPCADATSVVRLRPGEAMTCPDARQYASQIEGDAFTCRCREK